jgi:hypothetical protein
MSNVSQKLFNDLFNKTQDYLHMMTSIIRYYRHSNGSLCHLKTEKNSDFFNESASAEKIDTALSQIDDIFQDAFVPKDILRFSGKQSVLFLDLEIYEPRITALREYGKNFADGVLNFEWSVDNNNIINKNSSMIFQKESVPIFLRNKKGNARKNILNNFCQQKTDESFFFKGAVDYEETTSALYSFSRELHLLSQENFLCGIDTIAPLRSSDESLGLLQFYLGKGLRIVDTRYGSDKQNCHIFYDVERDLVLKGRKRSKHPERVLFSVRLDKQFFLKTALIHNFPVITIGYALDDMHETKVHWSFQVLKL